MVKFRGIEVSIISQFDIRKLPEFRLRQQSPLPPSHPRAASSSSSPSSKAVASCYVPIYPGSQVWFEYCIDGPHPPSAAYFFKFLLDGKVITSWDCTEKHDYHGKMMYNLSGEDNHPELGGGINIVRQALRFAGDVEDDVQPNAQKDVIEIRVHRIEHRKRIRDLYQEMSKINVSSKPGDNLQLSSGGLLEQGLPCRRYKYQLLDSVDEPYATFRFYYRTYDFLAKHGIITGPDLKFSSSPSSVDRYEALPISTKFGADDDDPVPKDVETPHSSPNPYSIKMVSSPSDVTSTTASPDSAANVVQSHGSGLESYLPPSDSEDSLSIVTRDSIEDLPSTVPRSPKSTKFPSHVQDAAENQESGVSPAQSPPLSPRRRLKKKLTVNISGAEFDLEPKKRPLSPFTSSGMLRKLTGGVPPSAPAALTEFGPTLEEEVQEKIKAEQKSANLVRTTRTERGGKSLMGFLGRRIGSA